MATTRWRFINRKDSSQTVVVEDQKSAEILIRIFGVAEPGDWFLQEEKLLGSQLPKSAVAFQPEAAKTESSTKAKNESPLPSLPQMPKAMTAPLAPVKLEELSLSPQEEEINIAIEPTQPKVAAKAPPALPPRPGSGVAPSTAVAAPPPPQRAVAAPVPMPVPATAKGKEKRQFKRVNMEFKVILVCQGKTFRTFSNDVSAGGMSIKHKVPEFMINNMCRIVISRRDALENIEFNCRILGGVTDPRRVQFVDVDSGAVRSFEQWIEKGINNLALDRQKLA